MPSDSFLPIGLDRAPRRGMNPPTEILEAASRRLTAESALADFVN